VVDEELQDPVPGIALSSGRILGLEGKKEGGGGRRREKEGGRRRKIILILLRDRRGSSQLGLTQDVIAKKGHVTEEEREEEGERKRET
jgi:hypothetical protein